jgi:hypothetical protein
MKRLVFILSFAALVTGCGVTLNKVLSASERTVIVQAISGDMAAAQKLADAECARYGRKARLAQVLDGTVQYVYDCVL